MSEYEVYLIAVGDEGRPCKIGISRDAESRLVQLQCASALPLSLLWSIPCASKDDALRLERELHEQFSEHRMSGEWFDLTDEQIVTGLAGNSVQ